ncbi:uncharacterized protein LOC131955155 [Physella acuta]|uniref:uncharacterized protein LOC131955155 n=1 Tax=Physella acuta TaxID=109671 RepID=UPI0027DC24C9|nr:uncharacterized protein LOC131955155 [Physella acuta]
MAVDFLVLEPSTTQPNNQVFTRWKEFDNIIEQFLLEQNIPGSSIAVSYDGEILYQQGYGTAGGGRRVQPSSLFKIASISKPITATIVMKLIEQQKLSLASRVFGRNGILKKYKTRDKRMKNITVQHLLQHSAGWDRDKVGDAVFVRPQCVIQEHPDTPEYNSALLSHALRRKLQFTPGTWHSYSNLGYLALGEIIEAVTNQPFYNSVLNLIHSVHIDNILLGHRKRACWLSKEVEYFNNKEPQVVDSLYPNEGEVLPQYGGMAMESSASYGGLVSDTTSLLQFVHCWEQALKDGGVCDRTRSTLDRTWSTMDTLNIAGPNYKEDNKSALWEDYNHPVNISPPFCSCGHRALCEKCLIKLHNLPEVKTHAGAGCSCQHPALLKHHLAVECMGKPAYENGQDWYGLGWDVQDGGHSWGHTGGMEGTSGTLFHHRSGHNWCLLLNSWASDSDLNGVVKCALSSVAGVSMYNCDVARLADNGGTRIMTRDLSQVILLGVSETWLLKEILQLQNQSHVLKQITAISENLTTTTKIHKVRFYPRQPNAANEETKYCAIFCKSTSPFNYFVLFNKSTTELEKAIEIYKTENKFVYYLDSYSDCNRELKFTAVFKNMKNGFNDENFTVYLAINAVDYIKKAKELINSYDILVQSVTSIGVNLYVSVVLSAKSQLNKECNVQVCTDTNTLSFSHKTNGQFKSKKSKTRLTTKVNNSKTLYWVQISPESFLTELNRQIAREMSLVYAKFYSADSKPYVSACWSSGQPGNRYQRTAISKYGLVPELAEAAAEDVALQSLSEYTEEDGSIYFAAIWYAK